MKSDDDVLDMATDWFKDSKDKHKDWRNEAKENYQFYAGDQWDKDDKADLEEQLRPAITFNRIQPMISAVKGHQINNRMELKFLPRDLGDAQVNEILTGANQWVDDECDAEDENSEIFEDLCITGMGWSETRISYDEDIDGKIHSEERVSPLEMYWDIHAKRRNLKDAKYVMRGRWLDRSDVEARWPEMKDKEFNESDFESQWDEEEGQDSPHDASRAHFYENDASQWYNRHKDQLFVMQVQWWDHQPVYRIGDGGELVELSENKFNKIKDQLDAAQIPYVRQLKKHFYQAFIAGPHVLENEDCPCPHAFTLRCATGKRDAMKNVFFGLVRGMKDPARWSNKFYSDCQDMISSNRQGGAFAEVGAFEDIRKAEDDWNQSNPLIILNEGGLNKIKERDPAPYPQAMDRMMQLAIDALPQVSGINLEMMGLIDRNQPNVLESTRKRSALGVLADLFDSMKSFNKERGRVVLYFITEYISDGRLIRVLGESGKDEYIQLLKQPGTKKYDVIIDEAASSPNQKQETFAVLMELVPYMAKMGMSPPAALLDYMPLPASLIQKIKESGKEKPPTEEEQMLKAEKQAEIKEAMTEAPLNEAKIREILANAEAQEIENEFVKQMGVKPGNA